MYKLDLSAPSPLASLPITGALLLPSVYEEFVPWEPSTWPEPLADDHQFLLVIKRIFELSMLLEISNVIEDAHASTGGVDHRGHVLAVALFCALDTISSYGYGARSGRQIPDFISAHFPQSYKAYAKTLLVAYRHAMVHSWNLFSVAILPGTDDVSKTKGIVSFGVLNLFGAVKQATEHYLESSRQEPALMLNTRRRYEELRRSATKAQQRRRR